MGVYAHVEASCPRNDCRRNAKPDGGWLPRVGRQYPGAISLWKTEGLKRYLESGLYFWHAAVASAPVVTTSFEATGNVVYEDEFQVIVLPDTLAPPRPDSLERLCQLCDFGHQPRSEVALCLMHDQNSLLHIALNSRQSLPTRTLEVDGQAPLHPCEGALFLAENLCPAAEFLGFHGGKSFLYLEQGKSVPQLVRRHVFRTSPNSEENLSLQEANWQDLKSIEPKFQWQDQCSIFLFKDFF